MAIISLSRGFETIVDDEDFETFSKFKWFAMVVHGCRPYAARDVRIGGKLTRLLLHREIIAPAIGLQVDHINGDSLDNRRRNLRACTPAQNNANRRTGKINKPGSIYKGVYRTQAKSITWFSQIGTIYLGTFRSEIEAAKAFDAKAREVYGEFACLNFPDNAA